MNGLRLDYPNMIFKTAFFLLLANLGLSQGISYCCNGENVVNASKLCLDGNNPKKLNCDTSFIMAKNDNTTKISHDDKDNLILDDEIIPPDEYCLTTLQSRNLEVYLLCMENDIVENISRGINNILQLVSVFFIIMTVVVYLIVLEKLDLQELCIIHSISALAVGYLGLSIINFSGQIPDGACHFIAYLNYFAFMYSFFWLNVLSFHIWRNVLNFRRLEHIKRWKIIYHVYGIGAPLLAVGWVMLINLAEIDALQHIHPGIGHSICWFRSSRETMIFFYGPIAILLVINVIFFIWTAVELWQRSKNCPKTKMLKYRLRMLSKLAFVMGLTWIFEIISSVFEDSDIRWLWIVTDILNALQGLIIFLILVVFRKKIKRAMANRKFCAWRFPLHWKNDKDSECEELEEAELSLDMAPPTKLNL